MKNIKTEDYLKNIYKIRETDKVTYANLARALGNKPPTVLEMVRKMEQRGWLLMQKPAGILLTPKGEQYALKIIRRHRLWESFLYNVLDFSLADIHSEAENLEHIQSERMEQKIAEILENPKFDPHGHPIPEPNGNMPNAIPLVSLVELKVGQSGIVKRISDSDPLFLQYLTENNLLPGCRIKLKERRTIDSSRVIKVDKRELNITEKNAMNIFVTKEK